MLYEPRQCSLFGDYIPESKLCFCLRSVPPARYIFNPTNTEVAQLSTTWRRAVGVDWLGGLTSLRSSGGRNPVYGGCCSRHSSRWGATKTVLWFWVREITWYLYTRGERGRMKAKQRRFKVTRELCHECFHHFRHHVHDGHRTGKFASHLASTLFHSLVPWWRTRKIRPQITRLSQLENSAMGTWPIYKNSIIPDCSKNGVI